MVGVLAVAFFERGSALVVAWREAGAGMGAETKSFWAHWSGLWREET